MTTIGWPWPILRQVQIGPFCFCMGKKVKRRIFSEIIVVYDIKLVDAVNLILMSTWSFKNIKGQDHSLTFIQGHSDSTFSNFFSLETPMPTEAHMEPPWDGGMKVSTIGLCHMTKMATMSIYGKNLLLWNEKADDLETFYTASVTQAQPNLFKWWPWVDLEGEILYSIYSCIPKLGLSQHILCTQVSDTGPVVLWFIVSIEKKKLLYDLQHINPVWNKR